MTEWLTLCCIHQMLATEAQILVSVLLDCGQPFSRYKAVRNRKSTELSQNKKYRWYMYSEYSDILWWLAEALYCAQRDPEGRNTDQGSLKSERRFFFFFFFFCIYRKNVVYGKIYTWIFGSESALYFESIKLRKRHREKKYFAIISGYFGKKICSLLK